MNNKGLHQFNNAKKDGFYTSMADIPFGYIGEMKDLRINGVCPYFRTIIRNRRHAA